MIMNEYCNYKQNPRLHDVIPSDYKNLLISNYIIYNKIKSLCTLLPRVTEAERERLKQLIEKLQLDWERNDKACTERERTIQPIGEYHNEKTGFDEYKREFRFTTSNVGSLTLEPAQNPHEEIIECPSNTELDLYEDIAINLQPSNSMFISEYEGQNTSKNYANMNYKLAKNIINDEDRIFC